MIGAEAGIEILQVVEAAREQAGCDQQQKRKRDLPNDERFSKTSLGRAALQDGGLFLENRSEIGTSRLKRRSKPEKQAGQQSHRESEGDDAKIGISGDRVQQAVI